MMEQLTGRNRRLQYEWRRLEERFGKRSDIVVSVLAANAAGMPVRYGVEYRIRSICGVDQVERLGEKRVANPPLFADRFRMELVLPPAYPAWTGRRNIVFSRRIPTETRFRIRGIPTSVGSVRWPVESA